MRSELQALLFDMDGLSVDTEPIWFRAERMIAERLGTQWSAADARFCVGGPVPKMARHIAERAGMPSRWEEIADAVITEVVDQLGRGVQLKPGIAQLIHQARDEGLPIALVSGSPRVVVEAVVSHLDHAYDVVVSADDVGESKPAPEPYLKAAAELGVEISSSVAFEDSITGMTSAESAGAFVVMVPEEPVKEGDRRVVLASLEGITLADIRQFLRR